MCCLGVPTENVPTRTGYFHGITNIQSNCWNILAELWR